VRIRAHRTENGERLPKVVILVMEVMARTLCRPANRIFRCKELLTSKLKCGHITRIDAVRTDLHYCRSSATSSSPIGVRPSLTSQLCPSVTVMIEGSLRA
jgi:hypothetical protein